MTLLLGATGVLGLAIQAIWPEHSLLCTHFQSASSSSIRFDVRKDTVCKILANCEHRPGVAIISLGITTIDQCALNPATASLTNVDGIIRLIQELVRLRIKPVFISSDAVFDGSQSMWSEEDTASPILVYGQHKLAVESYIRKLNVPWLILRLPKIISTSAHPKCMLTGWLKALHMNNAILCATDQYFTPISNTDAALAIWRLIKTDATGLYHIAGQERLSRRALLSMVEIEFENYHSSQSVINNCLLSDIPVLEPRPIDSSLLTTRFLGLGLMHFETMQASVKRAVETYFTLIREGH